LKLGFHFIGSRVGSPGAFQLWVRGSQRAPGPPPLDVVLHRGAGAVHVPVRLARVVALQVAFERRTLKPVFSLDRL
jgi:hypothetical protein